MLLATSLNPTTIRQTHQERVTVLEEQSVTIFDELHTKLEKKFRYLPTYSRKRCWQKFYTAKESLVDEFHKMEKSASRRYEHDIIAAEKIADKHKRHEALKCAVIIYDISMETVQEVIPRGVKKIEEALLK